jgi:hypothetical protein
VRLWSRLFRFKRTEERSGRRSACRLGALSKPRRPNATASHRPSQRKLSRIRCGAAPDNKRIDLTRPNRYAALRAAQRLIGRAGHTQDVVPRSLLRSQLDCPRSPFRSQLDSLSSILGWTHHHPFSAGPTIVHARGGLTAVHPRGLVSSSFMLGVDSPSFMLGVDSPSFILGRTHHRSSSGGLTIVHPRADSLSSILWCTLCQSNGPVAIGPRQ